MSDQTTHELDARHLMCPLPVIRAQDAVKKLNPGDVLVVTCTDYGALKDIPAWCRINGHVVLATHDRGHECSITLRVGHD